MIHRSAFQTRARTVDHLGREQIADCPTAISELWKNSFDAYARHVELNVYAGDEPVAAISDDGHGMSHEEFTRHWLVVGTESKAAIGLIPDEDRNGLIPRPRQGQKGIGRLSCANLGPLLLLVSKRRHEPFVAALLDWRLFENPFINLADIYVPVAEFPKFDQVFEHFPDLVASLSENITGGEDEVRGRRMRAAWSASDQLHTGNRSGSSDDLVGTLSQEILSTISRVPFKPEHFRQWPVASGDIDHGTALLVSGINYDLRVHLDAETADLTAAGAKARFFETLSSFVDPFVDLSDATAGISDPEFSYSVRAWADDAHRVIVGSEKQFDKRQVDALEHRIEGRIDSNGIFSGRVKAFGEWLREDCVIEPPSDLRIPHRRDSELGPLTLYIASMEFTSSNTTHSPSEFQFYRDLAEKYAGFMIFRDGLRVLPYGRTDNDFFDIESRRSKSAGREFWNHRQMFGCVSVTRAHNPNLKDKAGREGLLDNRAAKTLKGLIANILMQSARLYFGSASKIRQEVLPQISAENERRRAEASRERLRRRNRKEFRSKLRQYVKDLPVFLQSVEDYRNDLYIETDAHLADAQIKLEGFRERLSDFRLPPAPKNLGPVEETYSRYCAYLTSIQAAVSSLSDEVESRAEQINLTDPAILLEEQLSSQSSQIDRRIHQWHGIINALQSNENERIRAIVVERAKRFLVEARPLLHRFETEQMSYVETSKAMNVMRQRIDEENRELFVSYIGVLESLKESIDLEHVALFGIQEIGALRSEIERLNSLAQLGIAVEILGHELQSYDDMIGSGIKHLPKNVRKSDAVKDIEIGYRGLTDQLRFLSPLRLAGPKIQRWITGAEIFDYLSQFFNVALVKGRISFVATDSMCKFRVFDQQSRLYPVFINLLNNSIYWLDVSDIQHKRIILDVVNSEVVVSDNGPGVAPEDLDSLFSLFFTRKVQGGRGVGLYLCRANLTAAGHSIRYSPSPTGMPLSGANFLISFRGAELNGS